MKYLLSLLVALTLGSASLALALTPQQEERIVLLQKTGLDLLNQWKFSQAIPVYTEILTLKPGDKTASRYLALAKQQTVEPLCKQAASEFQDGNYKKAMVLWENIRQSNPGDTRIATLLDMTTAVIQANERESQFAIAEQLFADKEYYQAIGEFEKLLAQQPDDERARERLEAVRRAANADEIKGRYETADAYLKQGKYDLAIEEWQRILELDSTQEAASRFIAVAGRKKLEYAYTEARRLYEQGNYVEARVRYTDILAANPTDVDIKQLIERLNKLLIVVQKADDAGLAGEIVRKSVANYLAVNGNVRAAIVAVRYAEELDPKNTRIQAIRDVIERENMSEVRSMDPPSKDVSIIDQYLTFALNHIYDGRFDLAVQECEIVLILQPHNVMALKRLGSAYYATGKRAKAQEAWGKALQLSPNDSELQQFIKKTR